MPARVGALKMVDEVLLTHRGGKPSSPFSGKSSKNRNSVQIAAVVGGKNDGRVESIQELYCE